MHTHRCFLPVFFLFCLSISPIYAQSSQLFALVIGNSQYDKGALGYSPLKNAHKLANVLKQLCFQVDLRYDLNRNEMDKAIDAFTRRLADRKSIGIFYFAGRGALGKQGTFLLPINNTYIRQQADLEFDAIALNKILTRMAKDNVQNIMILDACYANPSRDVSGARSFCDSQSILSIYEKASSLMDDARGISFLLAFPNEDSRNQTDYADKLVENLATMVQRRMPIADVFEVVENQGSPYYELGGESIVFNKTCPYVRPFSPPPPPRKSFSIQPPTNLYADAGDGQITLTWQSVRGAAYYRIYWQENRKREKRVRVRRTTYQHTGLRNGTRYIYRVTAVSRAGQESTFSAKVVAIPQTMDITIPVWLW